MVTRTYHGFSMSSAQLLMGVARIFVSVAFFRFFGPSPSQSKVDAVAAEKTQVGSSEN